MYINYFQLYRNPRKLVSFIEIFLKKDLTKAQSVLLIAFNCIFIGAFTIFQTVELFRAENLNEFSEILGFQLTYLATCIKGLNILFRKQQILSLLKSLEVIRSEPWLKKTVHVDHRIKQISKFYKFLFCATIISCLFCFLDPYLFDDLIYSMWFPLDYENNSIVWWSLCVYQLINCFVYIPLLNVLNMFSMFLIGYAIGLIEELSEKLEAMTSVKRKKAQDKAGNSRQLETIHEVEDCSFEELLTCIKFQLKIKDFVAEITHIFAKTLWMQGFSSTLILCTTVFSMKEVIIFVTSKDIFIIHGFDYVIKQSQRVSKNILGQWFRKFLELRNSIYSSDSRNPCSLLLWK